MAEFIECLCGIGHDIAPYRTVCPAAVVDDNHLSRLHIIDEVAMTYEQIETFLTAVTYGSISAAAKYLYVSQSTISSRIQQLESELGVQLLIRQKGAPQSRTHKLWARLHSHRQSMGLPLEGYAASEKHEQYPDADGRQRRCG